MSTFRKIKGIIQNTNNAENGVSLIYKYVTEKGDYGKPAQLLLAPLSALRKYILTVFMLYNPAFIAVG